MAVRILSLPGAGGDGRFWWPVSDRLGLDEAAGLISVHLDG